MTLLTKLRDYLGIRPKLRNKPNGMAFIRDTDIEAINGCVVITAWVEASGMWRIDPPQRVRCNHLRRARGGEFVFPGEMVDVVAVHDDNLLPIDAGVKKGEVEELYLAGPVRSKETA